MSDETRLQVLKMLHDGQIDREQALELLDALGDSGDIAPDYADTLPDSQPATDLPDMNRIRRFWQIPFFISMFITLIAALWLRTLYQTSEGAITLWFVCALNLFLLFLVLTGLALISRRSPWVHVRIKEAEGKRIAISLPLPMRLARWGVGFARGFVPEAERQQLDLASTFLEVAQENWQGPDSEPLTINIDDDDGDKVQVYIG